MIFLKSAICHKIAKKDHRKSVNIRDENCATLSLPSLKWGNIKKSLFLHVSPSSGKTHSAPHAMTSVKFYSIYLSRPPSTGAECACRNDKWGWLWFFMDFNWPYRNDADINISFNDVFALKAIISIFISQRLRVPRWQIVTAASWPTCLSVVAGTFQNLITEAFYTTWRIIDDGVEVSPPMKTTTTAKPISILM